MLITLYWVALGVGRSSGVPLEQPRAAGLMYLGCVGAEAGRGGSARSFLSKSVSRFMPAGPKPMPGLGRIWSSVMTSTSSSRPTARARDRHDAVQVAALGLHRADGHREAMAGFGAYIGLRCRRRGRSAALGCVLGAALGAAQHCASTAVAAAVVAAAAWPRHRRRLAWREPEQFGRLAGRASRAACLDRGPAVGAPEQMSEPRNDGIAARLLAFLSR